MYMRYYKDFMAEKLILLSECEIIVFNQKDLVRITLYYSGVSKTTAWNLENNYKPIKRWFLKLSYIMYLTYSNKGFCHSGEAKCPGVSSP